MKAASETILERRRAFVRGALRRGGGTGFPATCRRGAGPDLLTAALVLPGAARSLTPSELARVVGVEELETHHARTRAAHAPEIEAHAAIPLTGRFTAGFDPAGLVASVPAGGGSADDDHRAVA